MDSIEIKNMWAIYDGLLTQYTHQSTSTNTSMRFSVFVPNSLSSTKKGGVLFFLAGLTCTDENFAQKATIAFQSACQHNLVIVLPDTSPRGANCPNDKESWDFGEGAGFYCNATNDDYSKHYNMYNYVVIELYDIIKHLLSGKINNKRSITGSSMGGLGALNLYLKSGQYQSCSAFSPLSNPIDSPWGQKAFKNYFGDVSTHRSEWEQHDPCYLVKDCDNTLPFNKHTPILIEQGLKDKFLEEQLKTMHFVHAAKEVGVPVIYNERPEFDHSYFFVHTFIQSHIDFHAKFLGE